MTEEPTPLRAIGVFVRAHLPAILDYCEEHPDEFAKLLDGDYTKQRFKQSYPFLKVSPEPEKPPRYWEPQYKACEEVIRVTSDWYPRHYGPFVDYLVAIGILAEVDGQAIKAAVPEVQKAKATSTSHVIALGDSPNLFVRHVLSRLGTGAASSDWEATLAYFEHRCAYCDEPSSTFDKDHVIPINRKALGDNRIGNLVPACPACNSAKLDKNFRVFLRAQHDEDTADRLIGRIESYMTTHHYVPLREHPERRQIQSLLEEARAQLKVVADEAVERIEDLLRAAE